MRFTLSSVVPALLLGACFGDRFNDLPDCPKGYLVDANRNCVLPDCPDGYHLDGDIACVLDGSAGASGAGGSDGMAGTGGTGGTGGSEAGMGGAGMAGMAGAGGCPLWYRDADGDGYSPDDVPAISACTSPGEGWTQTPTMPGDCADHAKVAHPGVTDFFQEPYDAGNNQTSWDYDCDGKFTFQSPLRLYACDHGEDPDQQCSTEKGSCPAADETYAYSCYSEKKGEQPPWTGCGRGASIKLTCHVTGATCVSEPVGYLPVERCR